MTAIHQFVHSFVDRDAISAHVRHLRDVIRSMGIESNVYAHEWRGEHSHASAYDQFGATSAKDTWILYHLSTASAIAEYLAKRDEHVVVNYHNITPVELFGPWEPLVGAELEQAREQLDMLAAHCDGAIGVSHFNEAELREAGYTNTSSLPILLDPASFERSVDSKTDAKLKRLKQTGGTDWLFVGRVAPHKCAHDVISAFAIYKRLYDPLARLHLVGGISSHRYWSALKRYRNLLSLEDDVFITESVSDGALAAYYKNADAFVCLSEHEGFGVPLIEALYHSVPVVAYSVAAVPETLGRGGLLLADKSPGLVAAAVNRAISDVCVNDALRIAGRKRVEDFALNKVKAQWAQALSNMIDKTK